jgi:hypothetical protein
METQLSLAAQEATFVYHTAVHNHSFKSMGCTTTIVGKLFNDKATCSQTKCKAIITNVIDFLFSLILYRVPFFPNVPVFGAKMEISRFLRKILWELYHHLGLVQQSH